jgi:hypothetical protein
VIIPTIINGNIGINGNAGTIISRANTYAISIRRFIARNKFNSCVG